MDLDLAGRKVIVSGGASHIGRAIAFSFAEEGAVVSILDCDTSQASRTVADIAAVGGKAEAFDADVTDLRSIEQAVGQVEMRFGAIDILVNNVGWNGRQHFFLELDAGRWNRSYRLNLFSVLGMTRRVLPGMVERCSGSIINIASDAAFGDYRVSDYGAMKAGVLSFTRSIAHEYGRYGVRVNAVSPGMVLPERSEIGEGSLWAEDTGLGPTQIINIEARTPLRRRTQAADVASAVVFLASSRARQLTGQVLSVSGGFQMPR